MSNRYTRRVWILNGISILGMALLFVKAYSISTDYAWFILGLYCFFLIIFLPYSLYLKRLKKNNPDLYRKRFSKSVAYEQALNAEGGDFQSILNAIVGTISYKRDSDATQVNVQASTVTEDKGSSIKLVSIGRRVGAAVIDIIIVFILFLILALPPIALWTSEKIPKALSISLFLVGGLFVIWGYPTFFVWKYGATFGKKIVGIKVIDINGQPITFRQAFARECLGKSISSLFYYLGFLWILWDKKHQGWHDKIAKTLVVKS